MWFCTISLIILIKLSGGQGIYREAGETQIYDEKRKRSTLQAENISYLFLVIVVCRSTPISLLFFPRVTVCSNFLYIISLHELAFLLYCRGKRKFCFLFRKSSPLWMTLFVSSFLADRAWERYRLLWSWYSWESQIKRR